MLADAPPPGFYPPGRYADWWVWVGALVLAVVAAWFLWVWWSTRPRPPRPVAAEPGDRLVQLRADALAQVDAVVSLAHEGSISNREAHQRFSAILRAHVAALSGLPAPAMTLSDLREQDDTLAPVATAVGRLYPPEFSAGEPQSVQDGAEATREVIRSWS